MGKSSPSYGWLQDQTVVGMLGVRAAPQLKSHFRGALILAEATCQVWWGENYFVGALFLDEATFGCGGWEQFWREDQSWLSHLPAVVEWEPLWGFSGPGRVCPQGMAKWEHYGGTPAEAGRLGVAGPRGNTGAG